jgi:NAD(P)-dependent dehydrogenase (short-subunit alcohol dehydrogenase family)
MLEGFVKAGHTVCGCSTSDKAVAELKAKFPAPHSFHQVNVADDRQVADWATAVNAAAQPFDLVVNNAAVINNNAPLWQVSDADFRRVMDVNVVGIANVVRHFLPAMVQRKKGVIVNFSSGWGRSTSPEVAPYCATKFAVEGLTQALAQELPEGMAAVPLNPGVINTDMLQSAFGSEAANYPTPEEWARTAVPFILAFGAKDNGMELSVPL